MLASRPVRQPTTSTTASAVAGAAPLSVSPIAFMNSAMVATLHSIRCAIDIGVRGRSCRSGSLRGVRLRVVGGAGAADDMVVDEAGGLHEGVHDGGAHEGEAARLEVLRKRIGLRRARGNIPERPGAVAARLAAHEAPDVRVEAAEFLLHAQERLRVLHRAFDLEPVADDAGILQQLLDPGLSEARDLGRIEVRERTTVVLALGEDRGPREAGLRALEREELEEHAIVVHRPAPLTVVVGDVLGAPEAPGATRVRHVDSLK